MSRNYNIISITTKRTRMQKLFKTLTICLLVSTGALCAMKKQLPPRFLSFTIDVGPCNPECGNPKHPRGRPHSNYTPIMVPVTCLDKNCQKLYKTPQHCLNHRINRVLAITNERALYTRITMIYALIEKGDAMGLSYK